MAWYGCAQTLKQGALSHAVDHWLTRPWQLIALDNAHTLASDTDGEKALFRLYNHCHSHGICLLLSAHLGVSQLPWQLADLHSRLNAMLCFQLPVLTDHEKSALLQHRAQCIGLLLDDMCARFILERTQRDMNSVITTLQALDEQSMIYGRKVTIPFIKHVLSHGFLA